VRNHDRKPKKMRHARPENGPTDADVLVLALRKRAEMVEAEIDAFRAYWLPRFPLEE
jgi:hypothetical protein